jgi:hypothetical protein
MDARSLARGLLRTSTPPTLNFLILLLLLLLLWRCSDADFRPPPPHEHGLYEQSPWRSVTRARPNAVRVLTLNDPPAWRRR